MDAMLTPLCDIIAPLLAQATQKPKSSEWDIVVTLGWLVVGAAAIVVIGLVARKIVKGKREEPNMGINFSMSDLRRMHREGQLSDSEFERMKSTIIANSNFAMNDSTEDDAR